MSKEKKKYGFGDGEFRLKTGSGEHNAEGKIGSILKYKGKSVWLSTILTFCVLSLGGCFSIVNSGAQPDSDYYTEPTEDSGEMMVNEEEESVAEPDDSATEESVAEPDGGATDESITKPDGSATDESIEEMKEGTAEATKDSNEAKVKRLDGSRFLSGEGQNVLLVENASEDIALYGTLDNAYGEVYTLRVGDKTYDLEGKWSCKIGDGYMPFTLNLSFNSYSIYKCEMDEDPQEEYVVLTDQAWGYGDAYIIDIEDQDDAYVYTFSLSLFDNYNQFKASLADDYCFVDLCEYYVGEDDRLHFRRGCKNTANSIGIDKYVNGIVKYNWNRMSTFAVKTFEVKVEGTETALNDKEREILKEDVLNQYPCDNMYLIAKEIRSDVCLLGAVSDDQVYAILRMNDKAYRMEFNWKQYAQILLYTSDFDGDGCSEVAMLCSEEYFGCRAKELYMLEFTENGIAMNPCPVAYITQFAHVLERCAAEGAVDAARDNCLFSVKGGHLEYIFETDYPGEDVVHGISTGMYIGEIKYYEDGTFEFIDRGMGDAVQFSVG